MNGKLSYVLIVIRKLYRTLFRKKLTFKQFSSYKHHYTDDEDENLKSLFWNMFYNILAPILINEIYGSGDKSYHTMCDHFPLLTESKKFYIMEILNGYNNSHPDQSTQMELAEMIYDLHTPQDNTTTS